MPPESYLASLRRICDRHGTFADFPTRSNPASGRAGRNFCFEYEDAKPDGLIVGKALGGGLMPVSAFVARRGVMDMFDPGSHGSTFGGNPLAAAVGREAIAVLQDEDPCGAQLRSWRNHCLARCAASIMRPSSMCAEKGLWAGVELDAKRVKAKDVCLAMLRRGVLAKETQESVVRLAPPLVIDEADLLRAVEIFRDALKRSVQSAPRVTRCESPPSAPKSRKAL